MTLLVSGPDDGHHRVKHVTSRNIELINAFIKVHQDISVVQRNFEQRNDYFIDHRTSEQQQQRIPTFIKPLQDITIQEGTR